LIKQGEGGLPSDIKKAAIALIISCLSTLTAVYFEGVEFEKLSYSDPFTFGINAIWALVVTWIIWDLINGKDIKPTLLLVASIMLAALIWDFIQFGFSVAQVFYAVELFMFILAYFLVKSEKSKAWYSAKNV